ncbi:MAG: hypothetical protein FWH01_05740 [Oscillospiraceae bacterium]|nr:hypothetical protein [Oscillospiraceae bacterium]
MAIRLTQNEADMLIEMLKKTVTKELELPSGKGRVEFDVTGDRKEDVFVVNISRKGINENSASYQGRVRYGSGAILMRLDVNPTQPHRNPGGDKIVGAHLHVYSEEYGERVAIPFDIENKDLFDLCYAFFKRFNIIEPPNVIMQMSI